MIDRSTREPPPGAAPGVSPNAVMESIDSGDFLAGVMRAGVAIAVRQRCDSGSRWWCATAMLGCSACARGGLLGLRGLAKGGCETSQGVSAAIFLLI